MTPKRDIVVVGTSAGGIAALRSFAALRSSELQRKDLERTRNDLESERARSLALFHGAPDPYVVTTLGGVISEVNAQTGEPVNMPSRSPACARRRSRARAFCERRGFARLKVAQPFLLGAQL